MVLWWTSCNYSINPSRKRRNVVQENCQMSQSRILVNILVVLALVTGTHSAISNDTVLTKYGPVKGLFLPVGENSDQVLAFLGIPYASPPTNAYRFMPPVAPLPWGETNLRDARNFPPACPQKYPGDMGNRTKALESMTLEKFNFLQKLIKSMGNQSEDCLYLNIYIPTSISTTDHSGEDKSGKLAIVLIIYAEDWSWGSGNNYPGEILAHLGHVIVVTFNFRLGVLGMSSFLKTSNQQSNFGLLDVIAALHWVRENGDSFGGDKSRITLLGYKCGGVIANILLLAQIAKGLFQRAILINGSALSPWGIQQRPEETTLQIAKEFGCSGRLPLSHPLSDLAPCLRRIPLHQLMSFDPETPRFLPAFSPFTDRLLIKNPMEKMSQTSTESQDQFLGAQLLLGFSGNEGISELSDRELRKGFESMERDKFLRTLVRNLFNYHQQEIFSIIRNEYTRWDKPAFHPIPLRDSTLEALADCFVIAPIVQTALYHSTITSEGKNPKNSDQFRKKMKTYLLYFPPRGGGGDENENEVDPSTGENSDERMDDMGVSTISRFYDGVSAGPSPNLRISGVGDIVPYLMGIPAVTNGRKNSNSSSSSTRHTTDFSENFSLADAQISLNLLQYFANFIKYGDPNSVSKNFKTSSTSSGRNRRKRAGLVNLPWWEPFESSRQSYMVLGPRPRIARHHRAHKMSLWLNLIPKIHDPGQIVSPDHHFLRDHENSKLYIGRVRKLLPLPLMEQIPDLIGKDSAQGQPSQSSTSPPTITTNYSECPSPRPSQKILSSYNNEDSLPEEVGIGETQGRKNDQNRDKSLRNQISESDEDSARNALTVTMTVGVSLLLLNLLVFSAIIVSRKRENNPGADHPHSHHQSSRNRSTSSPSHLNYSSEDIDEDINGLDIVAQDQIQVSSPRLRQGQGHIRQHQQHCKHYQVPQNQQISQVQSKDWCESSMCQGDVYLSNSEISRSQQQHMQMVNANLNRPPISTIMNQYGDVFPLDIDMIPLQQLQGQQTPTNIKKRVQIQLPPSVKFNSSPPLSPRFYPNPNAGQQQDNLSQTTPIHQQQQQQQQNPTRMFHY